MQQNELPEGWELVALPQIVKINMGQSPPGSTYNEDGDGLPFFQGKVDFTELYPKVRVYCTDPKKIANAGDVLLSIRAPVGPTNIANQKCVIGRGLAALTPYDNVLTYFILYFFRFIEPELSLSGTGSTFQAINKQHLENLEIPLPPLPEQHRIATAIEALFARLDATNERLDRVPGIMKNFRQAVLAAACDGRLTEDWREENQVAEDGTKLIDRIHENRLEISKGSGKSKTIPQIYKEIDTSDFPNVPISWTWTTLDQLVKEGRPIIYGIIKPGPHISEGVPYVRVNEMSNGEISDISSLKRTSIEIAKRFSRATLHSGDLLISKDGTIGKVAIVPPELEGGNINQHIVRASIHSLIDKSYIVNSIRSPRTQKWLDQEKKGVALQGVNVEDFRRLPLPIPPLPEQQEIVRRVDALFAFADSIEAKVAVAREKTEKLRQSILAKAFSGELVPTEAELARQEDREYESAAVLVGRIMAEKRG